MFLHSIANKFLSRCWRFSNVWSVVFVLTIMWRSVMHNLSSDLVGYNLSGLAFQSICLASCLFSFLRFCRMFLQRFSRDTQISCARVLFLLSPRIWLFSLRAHNKVWSFLCVRNNHIFGEWNQLREEVCYVKLEFASREGTHRPWAIINWCFSTMYLRDSINERPAAVKVTSTGCLYTRLYCGRTCYVPGIMPQVSQTLRYHFELNVLLDDRHDFW